MPHIKNPVQRQQQQNGLSYGQLMTLPEVQASNAPFPPGSKVYILNNLLEPSSIICSGEVVEILVKIEMSADKSALELIYKVRDENGLHALSRNNGQGDNSDNEEQSINFFFVNEKQIRFRNGCPVYLASAEEGNNESKEGIILGLCDVPRRLRSETTPYWYSIMLLADGKCEHEVTSHRVRYRHTTNDAASTDAAPLSGNIQQNVNDAIVIKEEQGEEEMSHSAESHEEVDGIMENILKKRKDIESDETTNTNTCTSTTQNETPEQSITERLSTNESHDAGVGNDILQEDESRIESHKMSSCEIDKPTSPCKKSQLDQNTMGSTSSNGEVVERGPSDEEGKDLSDAETIDDPHKIGSTSPNEVIRRGPSEGGNKLFDGQTIDDPHKIGSSSSNEVVQRGPSEERNDLSDVEIVDEPHQLNTEESSGWFSPSVCRRFSGNEEPLPQHYIPRKSTTSRRSSSSGFSRSKKKARLSDDTPTTDNTNTSLSRRSEIKYAYGCEIEFPLPSSIVIGILIGRQGNILESLENKCNSSIQEERIKSRANNLRHIFCIEGDTAEAITSTKSCMMDLLESKLPPNLVKFLSQRRVNPKGRYVLSDSDKGLPTIQRQLISSNRSPSSSRGKKKRKRKRKLSEDAKNGQGNYPYGCEVEFGLPSDVLIDILIGQQGELLELLQLECNSSIKEKRIRSKAKKCQHIFCIEGNTAKTISTTTSCMLTRLRSNLPHLLIKLLPNTIMVPKGKYTLSNSEKEFQPRNQETDEQSITPGLSKNRMITYENTFVSYNERSKGWCGRMSISNWARKHLPGDDVMREIVQKIGIETRCAVQFKKSIIAFESQTKSQALDARERAEAALVKYFSDGDRTRAIIDFCSARKGFDHIDNLDDIVLSHSWPYNADRAYQSICVENAPTSFYSLLKTPGTADMIYKSTGCEIYMIASAQIPYVLLRSPSIDTVENAIKAIHRHKR